jgi:hypothetical protein
MGTMFIPQHTFRTMDSNAHGKKGIVYFPFSGKLTPYKGLVHQTRRRKENNRWPWERELKVES